MLKSQRARATSLTGWFLYLGHLTIRPGSLVVDGMIYFSFRHSNRVHNGFFVLALYLCANMTVICLVSFKRSVTTS